MIISGWAGYFALAGIISFIAVFLFVNRAPRKLSFSFIAAGFLSLIVVPIVNTYKIPVMHLGTEFSSAPYEGYTIPLILVSSAYFLLSIIVLLYKKLPNWTLLRMSGFFLVVLSPMSLIVAAIAYAPLGPMPPFFIVPGTELRDFTLPLVFVSIGLFALGSALILYRKSSSYGFLGLTLGSSILFICGFTYAYKTYITELVFGYVPVGRYIYPIREYTLPLFLASTVLLAAGYLLIVKKKSVQQSVKLSLNNFIISFLSLHKHSKPNIEKEGKNSAVISSFLP